MLVKFVKTFIRPFHPIPKLIDDLLATGGTAAAAVALIHRLGAQILEVSFLIELSFLAGREKLKGCPVRSVVVY